MRKGLAVATVAALMSVFAFKTMFFPSKTPAAITVSISPYELQIAQPKLGNLPIERAALP
jgi:hypothetical protein